MANASSILSTHSHVSSHNYKATNLKTFDNQTTDQKIINKYIIHKFNLYKTENNEDFNF